MGIRIFLVDDHELLRRGLTELFSHEADIEVVGEAASAQEALSAIAAARPDVAVVDLRLPDGNGIEVCREIRSGHPEIRCLILTLYPDDDAVTGAILAGADGFVLKGTTGAKVVEAVRQVAAGLSLLDPDVTRRLLEGLREGSRAAAGLTAQQERLLELLGEGLTNREIGERLHLSEKTIRNYVSALLGRLGMRHRTEAALYAAERKRRASP